MVKLCYGGIMKYIRFLLIFIFFINFNSFSSSEVINKPSSTLKWTPISAQEVSSKANKDSAYGSGSVVDPFTGSVINGYYNMMKGGMGNAYEVRELQKQQLDYVRQQSQQTQTDKD